MLLKPVSYQLILFIVFLGIKKKKGRKTQKTTEVLQISSSKSRAAGG